jgi:hypothetical protein
MSDSCAWCPAPAVGTFLTRPGELHIAGGKKVWANERRAPVCPSHRDSIKLAPDPKAERVKRDAAAREWKAAQMALFDSLAFKVGGRRAGASSP